MRPSSSDEDETKDRLAAEIHLEAKGGREGTWVGEQTGLPAPQSFREENEWEECAGE